MGQSVKYVETFPKQQELIFPDSHTYTQFYDQRFREICVGEDWHERFKEWKYVSYKINKDGKPRKPINPTWLNSPKARKRQSIAWQNFLNVKREKAEQRKKLREKDEVCLTPHYSCKYCGLTVPTKLSMQGHLTICAKREEELNNEKN